MSTLPRTLARAFGAGRRGPASSHSQDDHHSTRGLVRGVHVEPEFRLNGSATCRFYGDKRLAILTGGPGAQLGGGDLVGVPRTTRGGRVSERSPDATLFGVVAPGWDPAGCSKPAFIDCTKVLCAAQESVFAFYGRLSPDTMQRVDSRVSAWLSDRSDAYTLLYAFGNRMRRPAMPHGALFRLARCNNDYTIAINISNPVIYSRKPLDTITYILTTEWNDQYEPSDWILLDPARDPVDRRRVVLHTFVSSIAVGDGCREYLGLYVPPGGSAPAVLERPRMNDVVSLVHSYLGITGHERH